MYIYIYIQKYLETPMPYGVRGPFGGWRPKKGDANWGLIFDTVFWLDTGTHDALAEASNFIKMVEEREGKKVSCIEEIAFKYNYINKDRLKTIINNYNNEYGNYLKKLLLWLKKLKLIILK